MTIAEQIILRNADAGITFYIGLDGRLKHDPPVVFTPEQQDCLRRHDAALRALIEADAMALLEAPCAGLGPYELITTVHTNESQNHSAEQGETANPIKFGLTNNGSVRKGKTTNTTAATATKAADRQFRLVRSE